MAVTTTDPTVVQADPEGSPSVRPDAPGIGDGSLVEEDLLVEDVSIDGMCGVY